MTQVTKWGLMRIDGNGNELGLLAHSCYTRKAARLYRNNYLANFDRLYTSKAKGGHGWKLKVGRVEVTHRWLG